MPRFRSFSLNNPPSASPGSSASLAAAPSPSGPSSPTLLTRGFRSIRRARRRSVSMPSSPPNESASPSQLETQPNAIPASSSANSDANSDAAPEALDRSRTTTGSGSGGPHIRMVPNLGIGSRCFVFDVIERSIPPGIVFKIGRYSDRSIADDRLSFKSKVVSRNHAELWADGDDKIFVRDVGSSSGTFVNRARLSAAGVPSAPQEIKDGDLVQLGVDYQGGIEPMFRAVRMRVELNREPPTVSQPFSRAAFQQLRQHLLTAVAAPPPTADPDHEDNTAATTATHGTPCVPGGGDQIQECCICLYAIAPLQALFISPCSHIFHFKCLRPLLFQNYPGFSCPICRSYSDLEASVAIEVSDILETMHVKDDDNQDHDHHHNQDNDSEDAVQPQEHASVPVPSTGDRTRSALGGASRGVAELSSTLVATPPHLDTVISGTASP